MAGGAPGPLPVGKDESPKEAKILCIADLEVEGSKKLPTMVRGSHKAYRPYFGAYATSQNSTTLALPSSSPSKLIPPLWTDCYCGPA
jgi:hypothetical protein